MARLNSVFVPGVPVLPCDKRVESTPGRCGSIALVIAPVTFPEGWRFLLISCDLLYYAADKIFCKAVTIEKRIKFGKREFSMVEVNNVIRLLDSRKILYTAYELPPEKLGALETARLLNADPAMIFKTIVVLREKLKKPLLVVVSGISTVDLKLLASALGEKKVYLPTEKEAEQLTGLQAGGIS